MRADLHAMGVRLRTPVRVRLATEGELDGTRGDGPATLGVTHVVNDVATGITVCPGMPRVHFGSTVAHESMHVWIRQHAFPSLSPVVEEGLCELTADEWLRRQSDPGPDLSGGPSPRRRTRSTAVASGPRAPR